MSNPSTPTAVLASEDTLHKIMQQAHVSSQRALAEKANVSRWQVQQLRLGKIGTMRLAVLKQLATALDCSLNELLQAFDPEQSLPQPTNNGHDIVRLRQEYSRLEHRLAQQHQSLEQQFQAAALQILESWLTYWPTAAKAATEREDFDAKKLLPLVKPIDRLVESWGVSVIGTVGEQLSYDPQLHQLTRGTANPGDLVQISNVGYRHGENLLQRVNVVPLNP
ncbi:MAG: helix-turn-helix domain-containing protein [Leptolyngbyaceae cyanobacterium]